MNYRDGCQLGTGDYVCIGKDSFIRRDGRGRLSRASPRNEILATAVGAASSVASMGDYLVAAGGTSVRFYDGGFTEVCSVELAGAVIAVCRSRGPEGAPGVSIHYEGCSSRLRAKRNQRPAGLYWLWGRAKLGKRHAPQNSTSSSRSPPGRLCMSWAGSTMEKVMKSGACRPTI